MGGKPLTIFVAGLVSIGIITALFSSGRQTAQGATAFGNAGAHLLSSAETGKA